MPEKEGKGMGAIGVFKKDKLIKTFVFKIEQLPSVSIELMLDDKPINKRTEQMGITLHKLKSKTLKFEVTPNSSYFEALCPEDTKFKVTKGIVTVVSGRKFVGEIKFNNGIVNLNKVEKFMLSTPSSTDDYRMIIEIKQVVHQNYRGQRNPKVKFRTFISSIPLNF